MLSAGFVYAWSILSAPIAAEFPAWSSAQLSLTFTLCMTFFCLGGIASGILARRRPANGNIRLAALLFAVGFFIASRAQSLPVLYLSYGVLCGGASGLAYNAVMNVVPRWFPDRMGLISGLLLMGFGASSMVIGALFSAVTPDRVGAWRGSLLGLGLAMAAVLFAASFFLRAPDGGASGPQTGRASTADYTPAQMLRQSGFWCLFFWAILLSGVGLIVISLSRGLVVFTSDSLSAGAISLMVGLISVCNGLGRILFGALYDKIGRRPTMRIVTLANLAGIGLIALSLSGGAAFLAAGFVCVGFGYGGTPTMNAAVVKQFYGSENYAVNFSILNTNLLPASFLSPLGASMYERTGTFSGVLLLLAALGCAALAVSFFVRGPSDRKEKQPK